MSTLWSRLSRRQPELGWPENDVRAEIDRKSGEIKLARYLEVVEVIENDTTEISAAEAKRLNPDADVGILTEPLPAD